MPLPHDKLTNLVHESETEEQVNYELQRARRYAWSLSFLLVEPVLPEDVGHDMNYPALRRLAITCTHLMRSVDKGIRVGSGILYILPETPKEGAETALGKVRKEFAGVDVPNPVTGEGIRCSVRGAHYTYEGGGSTEQQAAPPTWRQVLVQLRGDLQ